MNRVFKGAGLYLIPLLALAIYLLARGQSLPETTQMTVTELVEQLDTGEIKQITSTGPTVQGVNQKDETFEVFLPDEIRVEFYDTYLKDKVESGELAYAGKPVPQTPWYLELLPTFFVLLLLGGFWFLFMSQSQGGSNRVMSFGKSKARLHREDGEVITFDMVAGLKEEKEELKEIVDFLQDPRKYIELGARIPKGVLLVGPPGTGKTYLSKAVAGEAKVPFFSISGSDFVEMFVGVGASRVRDLFSEAKKKSPCIVFIDEIDAVGRRRGAGLGGGHDEREQTLNQLLVEMDGFGTNEGIIIMAATNRPDILDPAILRPGRFDRQVTVGLPDVRGREEILGVHTKNKKLDDDVNLREIAKRTAGFTPADIENLTNEAALLTARHNLTKIPRWIFEEAAIKVVAGPEKKSRVVIEKERVLTAYHEAGHAIVSSLLPDTDPVHMITIIPRGGAGGFTAYIPEEERNYMTKRQMEHRLITLLGGRAAEATVLDDISTGASNDIERATKIARSMVTHYGMSDKLGPMTYGQDDEEVFMGRDFGRTRNYSEEVAAEIDKEMKRIINDAYETAVGLLERHKPALHGIAKALLEKETLNDDEFREVFEKYTRDGVEVVPEELEKVQEMETNIQTELGKAETEGEETIVEADESDEASQHPDPAPAEDEDTNPNK
ncbi:MAG: ATP-dependent zinc metalloprotease FtsH [Bacillota bacterium]|nr:ATP-dependent zinc metalloprotease FtsH [Bacillota bacterium]